MKNKAILLVACMLFIGLQFSYGGFVIKQSAHKSVANKVITAANHSTAKGSSFAYWFQKKSGLFKTIFRGHPEKGALGNWALILGILSFIPLVGFIFGIPAIILGVKGIRKNQKHARLGMIFGICTISVGLILIILTIVLFP